MSTLVCPLAMVYVHTLPAISLMHLYIQIPEQEWRQPSQQQTCRHKLLQGHFKTTLRSCDVDGSHDNLRSCGPVWLPVRMPTCVCFGAKFKRKSGAWVWEGWHRWANETRKGEGGQEAAGDAWVAWAGWGCLPAFLSESICWQDVVEIQTPTQLDRHSTLRGPSKESPIKTDAPLPKRTSWV